MSRRTVFSSWMWRTKKGRRVFGCMSTSLLGRHKAVELTISVLISRTRERSRKGRQRRPVSCLHFSPRSSGDHQLTDRCHHEPLWWYVSLDTHILHVKQAHEMDLHTDDRHFYPIGGRETEWSEGIHDGSPESQGQCYVSCEYSSSLCSRPWIVVYVCYQIHYPIHIVKRLTR